MRTLAILTATAVGLAASTGFAPAQTNPAPKPGAAAKSKTAKPKKAGTGTPRRATGGEQRVRSSPAIDHAGAPGYE